MNKINLSEHLERHEREMHCIFVVLTLTPLAWIAGPVVWGWVSDSLTRGTAVWGALVVCLLGFWAPARFLLKSLLNNRIATLALLCLAVGGLGNWLQAMDFFVQGSLIILCMVVTGVVCFYPESSRKTGNPYPEPPPEQLRRYPLIRGLMRAVMAGKSDRKECRSPAEWRINRIALTGPWGSGKSLILDHVAYALEHHNKARAVKVNPWACTSVDQARTCLADGLRELLLDSTASSPPLFGTIAKALGYSDAIDAVFEYAGENRGVSLAKLDGQLRNEELKSGRRMLLVIDDMERSEPQIVRGLLPLLNELVELRWCTFLIAIDLDHFGQAFVTEHSCSTPKPEKQAATQSSKLDDDQQRITADGFLKKVIDFEIKMPLEAPPDRIRAKSRLWLGIEVPEDTIRQPHLNKPPDITRAVAIKLSMALPNLEHHLPSNPRELERFLDKANLFELCFLADYRQEEKDWNLFFHLWLMDTRFPGFTDNFEGVLGEVEFSLINGKQANTEKIVEVLGKKGMPKVDSPDFRIALQNFLGSRNLLLEDWPWYLHGFLCPPSLPEDLRNQLFEAWSLHPSLGLFDLIQQAFKGSEDPEKVGALADLLQYWISELDQAISRIVHDPMLLEKEQPEIIRHLENIFRSLEIWPSASNEVSILQINVTSDYLVNWARLSELSKKCNFTQNVSDLFRRVPLRLVDTLDEFGCHGIVQNYIFDSPERERVADGQLIEEIKSACWDKIRMQIWNSVKEGKNHPLYPNFGVALMEHQLLFKKGTVQREELIEALRHPSNILATGLKFIWTEAIRLLPRWDPGNSRDGFNQEPDFWLVLWHAGSKGMTLQFRTEIKSVVLKAAPLPSGLDLVRAHLSEEKA